MLCTLPFVKQSLQEKENSAFKPSVLRLKIDLGSNPVRIRTKYSNNHSNELFIKL